MEKTRVQIIKDILDNFGVFNANIILSLQNGESLTEYLISSCVIYPVEYDGLLNSQSKTFGEFADSLTRIAILIRKKQEMYRLCSDYCKYFLGAYLNYADLRVSSDNSYRHYDLRDENGYIDYKLYLEALGITDSENISEQYSGKGR